jgi:hypothetical protein
MAGICLRCALRSPCARQRVFPSPIYAGSLPTIQLPTQPLHLGERTLFGLTLMLPKLPRSQQHALDAEATEGSQV